jgi:hypothetical protein
VAANARVVIHRCGYACGIDKSPAKWGGFHPQARPKTPLRDLRDSGMLAALSTAGGARRAWSKPRKRPLTTPGPR